MPKPVALILLNWNTLRHTANCISSVLKHNNRKYFDIIIADNGSTDGSLQILKEQYPDLIYIDNQKNLGFAEGNNRAMAYSIEQNYTYSLLLNTDTEVDQDILTPLLTYISNHPEVGALQPAIYFLDQPQKLWNGGSYFNPVLGITYSTNSLGKSIQKKVDWITGCCFMVRNEVLKKTGLFNSKYFLYYEDVELSFRIRRAGYELHYLPNAKVYHEAGVSGKMPTENNEGIVRPIIHYYNSRNRTWFLRKNGNPFFKPLMVLYGSGFYGSMLIYFILRRRFKKAGFLLKGIKEGLFTPLKEIYGQNS